MCASEYIIYVYSIFHSKNESISFHSNDTFSIEDENKRAYEQIKQKKEKKRKSNEIESNQLYCN